MALLATPQERSHLQARGVGIRAAGRLAGWGQAGSGGVRL